jgi:hypothetical protein
MKKNNVIKSIAFGSLFIAFSCGIPKVTIKENQVNVPSSFTANSKATSNDAKVK